MKVLRMILVVLSLTVLFSFSAFAEEQRSYTLEELQEQNENDSYETDSRSSINHIADASRLDTSHEEITEAGNIMNSMAGKAMQFIGYLISIGLGIMTGLDICYISIAPLRGILANGHEGTGQGQTPTMAGMTMPGMKHGANLGKVGNNVPGEQVGHEGIQWVSDSALNAVSSASNGSSPFKVYIKQHLAILILCPVIFVLASTGVLTQLGFTLGQAVSNWFSNLSF